MAGAFAAITLGIAIYFVASLLNLATPKETMSAAKPQSNETMKSDATKDGTYLFDEAAKIFVK